MKDGLEFERKYEKEVPCFDNLEDATHENIIAAMLLRELIERLHKGEIAWVAGDVDDDDTAATDLVFQDKVTGKIVGTVNSRSRKGQNRG